MPGGKGRDYANDMMDPAEMDKFKIRVNGDDPELGERLAKRTFYEAGYAVKFDPDFYQGVSAR